MTRMFSSRLVALAIMLSAMVAMLSVSFNAEAQRRLGGGSVGTQSNNVTRQATPPAAAQRPNQAATPPAGQAARSGASRWLGPLAGIAAGLGLAALFSSLGLGGAMAEFLANALLIGAVVMLALFLWRRFRGGARANSNQPQHAFQGATPSPMNASAAPMQRQAEQAPVGSSAPVHPAVAASAAPAPVTDGSWFIPEGFDSRQFVAQAKQHFISLQKAWDDGDVEQMREFMTDELIEAVREPLSQRTPGNVTQVVLLNGELLGVEKIEHGHLASVRFSGMLRDQTEPEAYRFEEVWNFLKPEQGGWMLAGIQQIPIEHAS